MQGLPFRNRAEAGRLLASNLSVYANRPDTLVLALPRGGVPVAFVVARALNAPLDVFLVRKLGVPGHEELVVAVPDGASSTCDAVRDEADEVVCAVTPEPFHAVGLWYRDFSQVTDGEVRALLAQASEAPSERQMKGA